jgi:hypothetical protein
VRHGGGDGQADLMAKFIFKNNDQNWASSNLAEARKALEKSLPNIVCLVCKNDEFIIKDYFDSNLQQHQRSMVVYSSVVEFSPISAIPVFSLYCDRCGFVMQFDEDKLLRNSGVVAATTKEAKDG